jgi:hypothetical protein
VWSHGADRGRGIDGAGAACEGPPAELQFKEAIGAIAPLSLVAQNGSSGGDITCRITVDGEVVGESTSSRQYAVVTCYGNAR